MSAPRLVNEKRYHCGHTNIAGEPSEGAIHTIERWNTDKRTVVLLCDDCGEKLANAITPFAVVHYSNAIVEEYMEEDETWRRTN